MPLLVRLDDALPGALSRTLRGSTIRRASVFACLAMIDLDAPEAFLSRMIDLDAPEAFLSRLPAEVIPDGDLLYRTAYALTRLRASEALAAAYGDCPVGFLGAIRRVGDDPLFEGVRYRVLYSLFADLALRRKGRALRHLERVTGYAIDVVSTIDSDHLLTPAATKST